jgi:hypothetical protein
VSILITVHPGLLKRKDSLYFEDYREVDGVVLSFTQRGPNFVIKLTEIKHNLAVDDAQLVEQQDCFTKWRTSERERASRCP